MKQLQQAWLGEDPFGHFPVAFARVNGVLCRIETPPGLVESGVARCYPAYGQDMAAWPMGIRVRWAESTREETLWGHTSEPRIVAAARRYLELRESGKLVCGADLCVEAL